MTIEPRRARRRRRLARRSCATAWSRPPYQLVAIDHDSRAHPPVNMNVMTLPPNVTTTSTFDLPPEQISRLELQAKSFTRFVDATDVALRQGVASHPRLSVRTMPSSSSPSR